MNSFLIQIGSLLTALLFLNPGVVLASSQTFTATGADQTFTVPPGVTALQVQLWGAGGGGEITFFNTKLNGGSGGYTSATLAVAPGQQLTVVSGSAPLVWQAANNPLPSMQPQYGGGGAGDGDIAGNAFGLAGGGRSAIRAGGAELVTAGGGGGLGVGGVSGVGGAGGGLTGEDGSAFLPGTWGGGKGGTQVQGGAGGGGWSPQGNAGSQFQGGGYTGTGGPGGAGGGGGWFGGGGGWGISGSGGGGSGYCGGAGVSNCTTTTGAGSPSSTDGKVVITWTDVPQGTCPLHSHGTFPDCVCDNGYTGNGQTGSDLVCTPNNIAPTLSCSVTFDQNPITQGNSTTIHWTSAGSPTAFYLNSIGYVGASGQTQVSPAQTTDYSGTVYQCPDGTTLSADRTQCVGGNNVIQDSGSSESTESQSFVTPGTYTFTTPSHYDSLTVTVNGAGGGGAGFDLTTHGMDGTNSSFNDSVIGYGGRGGPSLFSWPNFHDGHFDPFTLSGADGGGSGGNVLNGGGASGGAGVVNIQGGQHGGNGGNGGQAVRTYTSDQLPATVGIVIGSGGAPGWALPGPSVTLPQPGSNGSVIITWTHSTGNSGNGGSGSVSLPPQTATCPATLTVTANANQQCPAGQQWDGTQCISNAPINPPIVVTVTPVVPGPGNTATWNTVAVIHWNAQNASSCTSPDFNTNGATSGTITTDPIKQTTTYTITCDTGTRSVKVFVLSCPMGFTGTPPVCVAMNGICPAGWTGDPNNCTAVASCPLNYTGTPPNCIADAGTCPVGYAGTPPNCVCSPVNICSGHSVINSCTGKVIQACVAPSACLGGACTVPAPRIVSWHVAPTLVASGHTTTVTWDVVNVSSCAVTGTNHDSWTDLSGSQVSRPITTQTIFTLACHSLSGSGAPDVSRSTTVNIVPIFRER